VGRDAELAVLRAAAEALGRGEGTVIWVEGEPGIGKSSLVSEALAVAGQPGWDVGWGAADQLSGRLPLRVMQDCLQVRPNSPDPRRAQAASLLRGQRRRLLSDGDASVNATEVLLTLVDNLCAAAPAVLVLDDLQWADEASLTVWQELAASISQLRLLLIGTCRPAPRPPAVQQARVAAAGSGGQIIALGPLPEPDVTAMVTALIGASPGDGLRQLTAQAAGNPLYVRELVDALLREQAVQLQPVAELALRTGQLTASLTAVLDDRLGSVSAETAQLLRTAALLGGRFAVSDLAVVLRRPAADFAGNLQEAAEAGIVDGSSAELAFRHPLIRQALYENTPEALRTALHAEAARELAAAGADTLGVAQQLAAARRPGGSWARAWLTQAGPVLATRAPQLAVELLRRELQETPDGDEARDALAASLIRALLADGGHQEAIAVADRALAVLTDPAQRGETSWMLVNAQVNADYSFTEVIAAVRQALTADDLPRMWQARLLALLAILERSTTGLDVADAIARQALAAAEEAGDPATIVHVTAIPGCCRPSRAIMPPRWPASTARCSSSATTPPTTSCTPTSWNRAPSCCRTSTSGRKPSWRCSSPASSACAPAARTARPGLRRQCCATASASGTTRWPSWARMPPTIPGWSIPGCVSAGRRCWSTAWRR
jgi:tetratricopeptide (TPR) repeat protein